MIDAMTLAGIWLVQRASALPDTVFTKQIATAPSTFDRVTGVASGLLTIAFCIFVAAAVPAAWNFRKSYRRVNQLLERIYGDINPIMRHASSVADNINYITTSIRTDVQQINATIATANERLQQAVQLTERRLGDFNALLQVVQEEAEQMFVSTASAMRGVRTSASALSGAEDGPNLARRSALELDQLELDSEIDTEEEMTDGYDSDAPAPTDDFARPRLRPRHRGSRRQIER
jgi:methyl-accepting chemotaxis protein